MTETQSHLAAALAELQAELPEIKKSETADTGKYTYTYAGLAAITERIMPLLSKHGLSFITKPAFVGDRFVLACSLLHKSGEREDGEYPLPTTGTPQAIGSAITYGRRYSLCAMTGIAPEEDDDGAAAEAEKSAQRGTARRASQPRTQQTPRKQTAQRKSTSEPPPLPGEDQPDGITKAQMGMLHASLAEIGKGDREDGLKYIGGVIGREIESSKQLTKVEASKVIDAAKAALEQPFPEPGDE